MSGRMASARATMIRSRARSVHPPFVLLDGAGVDRVVIVSVAAVCGVAVLPLLRPLRSLAACGVVVLVSLPLLSPTSSLTVSSSMSSSSLACTSLCCADASAGSAA